MIRAEKDKKAESELNLRVVFERRSELGGRLLRCTRKRRRCARPTAVPAAAVAAAAAPHERGRGRARLRKSAVHARRQRVAPGRMLRRHLKAAQGPFREAADERRESREADSAGGLGFVFFISPTLISAPA